MTTATACTEHAIGDTIWKSSQRLVAVYFQILILTSAQSNFSDSSFLPPRWSIICLRELIHKFWTCIDERVEFNDKIETRLEFKLTIPVIVPSESSNYQVVTSKISFRVYASRPNIFRKLDSMAEFQKRDVVVFESGQVLGMEDNFLRTFCTM